MSRITIILMFISSFSICLHAHDHVDKKNPVAKPVHDGNKSEQKKSEHKHRRYRWKYRDPLQNEYYQRKILDHLKKTDTKVYEKLISLKKDDNKEEYMKLLKEEGKKVFEAEAFIRMIEGLKRMDTEESRRLLKLYDEDKDKFKNEIHEFWQKQKAKYHERVMKNKKIFQKIKELKEAFSHTDDKDKRKGIYIELNVIITGTVDNDIKRQEDRLVETEKKLKELKQRLEGYVKERDSIINEKVHKILCPDGDCDDLKKLIKELDQSQKNEGNSNTPKE